MTQPHAPIRDLAAQIVELVSQHTVAALGIVLVEFVQHLEKGFLFLLANSNRLFAPLVAPLLGARHATATGTRSGASQAAITRTS